MIKMIKAYLATEWFAFLFNGISTFIGYLMSKPSLSKCSWRDKGVHAFLTGISLEVKVIGV